MRRPRTLLSIREHSLSGCPPLQWERGWKWGQCIRRVCLMVTLTRSQFIQGFESLCLHSTSRKLKNPPFLAEPVPPPALLLFCRQACVRFTSQACRISIIPCPAIFVKHFFAGILHKNIPVILCILLLDIVQLF